MQIIIILIIIFFLFFAISSFKSVYVFEIYGQEDLVIDEKVDITISKDNETLIVPAKIGIDPNLWKDHSFDNYSVDPNYTSPLNTKNYNGTVHMESIRDREFTLENFLDVWGFDKDKITNIFCSEKIGCGDLDLILTDGQNLKLQIKNDAESYNSRKYVSHVSQRITFDYPSKWNLIESKMSSEYLNGKTLMNKTSPNLIKVFPTESEYMTTPLFSILINKLDSNQTELDEFVQNNIYKLVEANENTFPRIISYNKTEINDTKSYQIFLNTILVAEPGSLAKGNNNTQKEYHIWTLKDGYFYDVSYKAFENVYDDYYPVVDKIIKSIQLQ